MRKQLTIVNCPFVIAVKIWVVWVNKKNNLRKYGKSEKGIVEVIDHFCVKFMVMVQKCKSKVQM